MRKMHPFYPKGTKTNSTKTLADSGTTLYHRDKDHSRDPFLYHRDEPFHAVLRSSSVSLNSFRFIYIQMDHPVLYHRDKGHSRDPFPYHRDEPFYSVLNSSSVSLNSFRFLYIQMDHPHHP